MISIHEILHDSQHELGVDPGLQKDGVEADLQRLLAEQIELLGDGHTLVRREYMTAIGPVDILARDAAGAAVAVEIKRRGDIDGVEQLTRYLELMNRDPLLAPVTGVFAAQEIKPQARTLATDRGIRCLVLDYDAMRGLDDRAFEAVLMAASPRAVHRRALFDLDGTIVDSAPGITATLAYTFERLGLPVPSPAELLAWVGPPILDSFRDLAGFDAESPQRALDIYRPLYLDDRSVRRDRLSRASQSVLQRDPARRASRCRWRRRSPRRPARARARALRPDAVLRRADRRERRRDAQQEGGCRRRGPAPARRRAAPTCRAR